MWAFVDKRCLRQPIRSRRSDDLHRHALARTIPEDGRLLSDSAHDLYQQHNLSADEAHAAVLTELRGRLHALVVLHDQLLPWEELLRRYGLVEAWNKSQVYFGLPLP